MLLVIPSESRCDRVKKSSPKENWSDSDLLRCSAKGDEQAFLILYRRYQGPVFRFALHMSGKREIADEVTQEVFMMLLRDLRSYGAERGSLEAYLLGAARNQVRRQVRYWQPVRNDADLDKTGISDSGTEAVDAIDREETLRALRSAILSLPINYREVVVLCDLEEMDYEHAAAQIGCAVGTVRSRLHRARVILAEKLRRRETCPA